jgi:hypothetical protein
MFEVIKLFVEQVFKILNIEAIAKLRDRRNLAELGADLFALYTTLNFIYVTGLRIVSEIETIVRKYNQYIEENRFDGGVSGFDLPELCNDQLRNLRTFAAAFTRIYGIMNIVDPRATREMHIFIGNKVNIIYEISGHLNGKYNNLAFSPTYEENLINVIKEAKTALQDEHDNTNIFQRNEHMFRIFDIEKNEKLLDGLTKPESESLNDISYLSEEDVHLLSRYLETRKPRDQLEKLRDILDKFHENLLKNFELKDLLLKVGDDRLKQKSFYWDSYRPRPDTSMKDGEGWRFPKHSQKDSLLIKLVSMWNRFRRRDTH